MRSRSATTASTAISARVSPAGAAWPALFFVEAALSGTVCNNDFSFSPAQDEYFPGIYRDVRLFESQIHGVSDLEQLNGQYRHERDVRCHRYCRRLQQRRAQE